jgi:hypothetical protein
MRCLIKLFRKPSKKAKLLCKKGTRIVYSTRNDFQIHNQASHLVVSTVKCKQVRDLMVFIEAQRALETTTGGAEIRDGTVLALPANVSPSTKSNGRSLKAGKKKK